MANLFERVAAFYEASEDAEDVAPQARLERYLRRQLWRGAPEDELETIFRLAQALVLCHGVTGFESQDGSMDLPLETIVDTYCIDLADEAPTEARVRHAFDLLEPLLAYLYPEFRLVIPEAVADARAVYYEDGRFLPPSDPFGTGEEEDEDELAGGDLFDELDPSELDVIINHLLDAILSFYRAPKWRGDLERAMTLFFGPMHDGPDAKDEAALQQELAGFWDFFLFDYHAIADDRLPVAVFAKEKSDNLPPEQRAVLRELLVSRFTIFYVERLEGDAALCRDLFTGAEMELPRPETGGQDPRKTLLYGHVHADGVMLLNHILIVPATAALRRRIKEEIGRLYDIYRMQQPDATMDAFFARHAAAVRHLIAQMTSYAQLTVVPEVEAPMPIEHGAQARAQAAAERLRACASRLHFSAYEQDALLQLYGDAAAALGRAASPRGSEDGAFLAAATMYFAIQNVRDVGDMDAFFALFRAEKNAVVSELSRIFVALGMRHPDPRCLTECGFVHLLFEAPEPSGGEGGAPRERSVLHGI